MLLHLLRKWQQIQTTEAIFQINNAKLYVPVVTLSINDNIKILENIKQGFKRTISWSKCRSEIIAQSKGNNLDYLIGSAFKNINRLFVLSYKNGNNNPTNKNQIRSVWKTYWNVEKQWLYSRKFIRLFVSSTVL